MAKDIVLRHDAQSEIDKSSDRKLAYKWYGPYRIKTVVPEKGTYTLEELDGTLLPGTFAGNRLKKFVKRKGIYEPEVLADDLNEGSEEERKEEESEEDEQLRNGDPFEIVVPQLDEDRRREYVRYEDEET